MTTANVKLCQFLAVSCSLSLSWYNCWFMTVHSSVYEYKSEWRRRRAQEEKQKILEKSWRVNDQCLLDIHPAQIQSRSAYIMKFTTPLLFHPTIHPHLTGSRLHMRLNLKDESSNNHKSKGSHCADHSTIKTNQSVTIRISKSTKCCSVLIWSHVSSYYTAFWWIDHIACPTNLEWANYAFGRGFHRRACWFNPNMNNHTSQITRRDSEGEREIHVLSTTNSMDFDILHSSPIGFPQWHFPIPSLSSIRH